MDFEYIMLLFACLQLLFLLVLVYGRYERSNKGLEK